MEYCLNTHETFCLLWLLPTLHYLLLPKLACCVSGCAAPLLSDHRVLLEVEAIAWTLNAAVVNFLLTNTLYSWGKPDFRHNINFLPKIWGTVCRRHSWLFFKKGNGNQQNKMHIINDWQKMSKIIVPTSQKNAYPCFYASKTMYLGKYILIIFLFHIYSFCIYTSNKNLETLKTLTILVGPSQLRKFYTSVKNLGVETRFTKTRQCVQSI